MKCQNTPCKRRATGRLRWQHAYGVGGHVTFPWVCSLHRKRLLRDFPKRFSPYRKADAE